MNITLTPQLEELVKTKVASGRYGSESEVLSEALRLLEERDRTNIKLIEELKVEIKKGLDSGRPTPLDIKAIKARSRQRFVNHRTKATG
ncbi:MAG: type II toxin-antitoxin system ParD family antitoxin [Nitrospirae bacterium]|nr:type II toxin-antitoxin system ParD family antitoxin [Nitrospirota bacterium]